MDVHTARIRYVWTNVRIYVCSNASVLALHPSGILLLTGRQVLGLQVQLDCHPSVSTGQMSSEICGVQGATIGATSHLPKAMVLARRMQALCYREGRDASKARKEQTSTQVL